MKKIIPFNHFNQYVLRTPTFPISNILSILNNKDLKESDFARIFKDELFLESVLLSSKDLFNSTSSLASNKNKSKVLSSLLKYYTRMSTRCTPFGLFAGVSIGTFFDNTDIELDFVGNHRVDCHLDLSLLMNIVKEILNHPKTKYHVKYYPNTSLYFTNGDIKYIETTFSDYSLSRKLIKIQKTRILLKVLNFVQFGLEYNKIVEKILKEGYELNQATNYTDQLIDSQILISELQPEITGEDFLNKVISFLKNFEELKEIEILLDDIHQKLSKIGNTKIGGSTSTYLEIYNNLKRISKENNKFIFHTDLFISTKSNTLNHDLIIPIQKGIEILTKITSLPENDNIGKFIQAFKNRYDEKIVSVVEALDPEIGIGYGQESNLTNPLIEDLIIPEPNISENISMDSFQSLLFRKYIQALKENNYNVEINDEDLNDIDIDWNKIPNTLSVMTSILFCETSMTYKIYIKGIRGFAASFISRFASSDKKIKDFVSQIAKKEQELAKEYVYAEIIHLPEHRAGNILIRPRLFDYEIPYNGFSSVNEEFYISINDLFIKINDGNLELFSKKLRRRILPILSSSHIYWINSLPIYNFLCDYHNQNIKSTLSLNWGWLENKCEFLPRISYDNIILSLARWSVTEKELEFAKNWVSERINKFQEWRDKRKIPEIVLLIEGDNELVLNLNNEFSIKNLILSVKKNKRIFLKEFLFSQYDSIVKNSNENYANEFVLSFFKNED